MEENEKIMTEKDFSDFFKEHFRRTTSFFSGLSLMIVDMAMMICCIGAGFFIVNFIDHSLINFRSFINYSIYFPVILTVFYVAGLYPGIMISPAEEVKKLGVCSFFCFAGIALSISVETDDRIAISIAFLIAIPFAIFCIPVAREICRHFYGKFGWWGVPAVVFMKNRTGDIIIERLFNHRDLGYMPALIVFPQTNEKKYENNLYKKIPAVNSEDVALRFAKKFKIKVAIVCDNAADLIKIRQNFRYTIMVPGENDAAVANVMLRDFGGILALSTTNRHTKKLERASKRLIDIFLSLLFCPLVLVLTIGIALAIKFTSKGPVFYGHTRIGKKGKPFKCWKFRSMVADAEEQLQKILREDENRKKEWERDRKFCDDPRITKIGKILRHTSLDELPQLWNIFIGEMSFIGPRPVTKGELQKYGEKCDLILSVLPGLSGMWQISGRSDTIYEERVTLDTYYVQNWSLWLDLWIATKTIWTVLKGKGAY